MTPCKRGLHDLDDLANAGVQRSTGRQFCKACKAQYRRARRAERAAAFDLCMRGLHDMSDGENVYVRPVDGRRECRVCKADAAVRRKERKAEAARAKAAEAEGLRALLSRAPLGVGSPASREAAARRRLAVMVRASIRR